MQKYFVLFAMFLLAAPAGAQMAGEESKACVQNGLKAEGHDAKDWHDEAERFRGDNQNVSRQRDRLRLTLEGGKTVELMDCPFGDAAYGYLYEKYDASGRFYVIRKPQNEDFSYVLVMRRTGRLFTVYGAPVWASDKSRFLTVACSLLPSRGSLAIHVPAGDGLSTEAEIGLPCETESCSARWDFQSWISVTCAPRGDAGKKGTEFVMMRGNDGSWTKVGR